MTNEYNLEKTLYFCPNDEYFSVDCKDHFKLKKKGGSSSGDINITL